MTKNQQKKGSSGPAEDDEVWEKYEVKTIPKTPPNKPPQQSKPAQEPEEALKPPEEEEPESESRFFIKLKVIEELDPLLRLGDAQTFLYLFLKRHADFYSGEFGSRKGREEIWGYSSIGEAVRIRQKKGKAIGEVVKRAQIEDWLKQLQKAGLVNGLEFIAGDRIGCGVKCFLTHSKNHKKPKKLDKQPQAPRTYPTPKKGRGGVVL